MGYEMYDVWCMMYYTRCLRYVTRDMRCMVYRCMMHDVWYMIYVVSDIAREIYDVFILLASVMYYHTM